MTNTTNAPGNWHPDPSGRHELRYWDGAAWTHSVASGGVRSMDTAAVKGSAQPINDVSGSVLLVGGLRRYLLWGPIVVGVGMVVLYAGALTGGPTIWPILGILIAIVGWIVGVLGIVQLVNGVGALAPLLEVAARASLHATTPPSESWSPPTRATNPGSVESSAAEAPRTIDEPLRVTPPGIRLPRPSDRRY